MAVVSLSQFEPEEIPGIHPERLFPKMDVSSYDEIWTAVGHIAQNCISKFLTADSNLTSPGLKFVSDTGWEAVGTSQPILSLNE